MDAIDIRYHLLRKGIKLADIARAEGVSPTFVSLLIRGQRSSISVARRIARIVGQPVNQLWPGVYGKPRPRYRDRIDRQAA